MYNYVMVEIKNDLLWLHMIKCAS